MYARTASLAIVAIATLGLAACGTETPTAQAPQPTVTVTAAPTGSASEKDTTQPSQSTTESTQPSTSSEATTSSAPATPVTEANLPSAQQIKYLKATFTVQSSGKGEGQATIFRCQTTNWEQLGANATFARNFVSGDPNSEGGRADVTIASFDSHDQAVAAAKKMTAAFATCGKDPKAMGVADAVPVRKSVTLPTGQSAELLSVDLRHDNGETSNEQTGVVVTGTHAQLLVIEQPNVTDDHQGSTAEILATLTETVTTLA